MKKILIILSFFLLCPLIFAAPNNGNNDIGREDRFGNSGDDREDQGYHLGTRKSPPTVPEWPVGILYGSSASALGLGFYFLTRKSKKIKI